MTIWYSDKFADPMDVARWGITLEPGTIYSYGHMWDDVPLGLQGTILIE